MNGVYEWTFQCIRKHNNDLFGIVEKIDNILTDDDDYYNSIVLMINMVIHIFGGII